jgi:hypothetical protein
MPFMPERFSPEIPTSAATSASTFEVETRADFHVGNPEHASLDVVHAARDAKSFAESSHPNIEQVPTLHGAARILTLYVIRLRRSKQSEPSTSSAPKPPTQDDYDLAR